MSPPTAPTFLPPPSGVTVRMYNPGFGDCLLLAFRAEDGSSRYMLIDCGVHHQYPDGQEKIQAVVEDIAAATNRRLHLVVATHEHTDHLTGFDYARDIFNGIEIEDLWLAWTEDPADPVAAKLKQRHKMRVRGLNAAVNQLRGVNEPLAATLQQVLNFEYVGEKSSPLDYLRSKSQRKLLRSEDYRHPGEAPLDLPGVKGVKFYVLGPPHDEQWIQLLESESELYPELTALDEADAFTLATLATSGAESLEDRDHQLFQRSCPFDPSLQISRQDAPNHSDYGQFFQKHYGFPHGQGDGPEWRRIDDDWLAASEQLALKINNMTNNTSLVLAIELTQCQPRKVLLFAADAQVGNWLSWDSLTWPGEGEGGASLTVKDLLRRTVLYKVGHHGSRNATLSVKGLERMESPDLVAMIPVDEKWANKMTPPWKHPAAELLKQLKEKARWRVLRSDEIPQGNQSPAKPDEATATEWDGFIQGLDWDRHSPPLWVQYTVTG